MKKRVEPKNDSMYVTIHEAAVLLRTTAKALYTAAERGQLPGLRRAGRRLLVNRAELVAWIESCASSTGSARG